jgi:hypothetical protein
MGVNLPTYYLKGEKLVPGRAAPQNKELREELKQYFK